MPRYISRKPRSEDDAYYEPPFARNIDVTEARPIDTGLLDSAGNSIFEHSGDRNG